MSKVQIILLITALLIIVWIYLFFSLFSNDHPATASANTLQQFVKKDSEPIDLPLEDQDQPKPDGAVGVEEEERSFLPAARKSVIDISEYMHSKLSIDRKFNNDDHHFLSDPPPLSEIERNMTIYLTTLHRELVSLAGPTVTAVSVWETFLNITKRMPMTWDEENKHRFPKPRKDGSIYVSIGTYRDPFCPMTIKSLFDKARAPDRVFVGLFQQNCFGPKCRTGVLAGGRVEEAGPDPDCFKEFCQSEEGRRTQACVRGQVRLYNVNESESLGPYMARYLGAKFYRGEQYYLQIDSHSEFVDHWDDKLIKMVEDAPAEKPVISTYPPDSTQNWRNTIGFRMCDSEFAAAQIEWQIIRLGSSMTFDHAIPAKPLYAPFVAAGFFFTYADFLYEVPFDPFLPWIFMGEEISMSARLWTAGYDIFSPTINVLNHYYVRRHYPKFWESVNR